MKQLLRYFALLLSLGVLLSALGACGREDMTARERLSSLLRLFEPLPAGQVYATAPTAGDEYLDARLIEALYRRSDGYFEYEGRVSEAAVYLGSARDPFFEAAVFVCYGNADTRAILDMCIRRVRLVASSHSVGEEDAVFAVSGRTVICIITKDTATANRVIEKLV